jgi:hypothetical protein
MPKSMPGAARGAAASLGGEPGLVTCQVLPPDFPGYDPYCPDTLPGGGRGEWTTPDISQAQRLVRKSGTKGTPVTADAETSPGPRTCPSMRRLSLRGTEGSR